MVDRVKLGNIFKDLYLYLFDKSKKFVAFGFEAEDMYSDLTLDQLEGDWYYFRRFKMLLYNSQVSVILYHFQADHSVIYRQKVH